METPEAAATRCPKCGAPPVEGAASCPKCGLLVARWAGFDPRPPAHPALDVALAELQPRWEDPAAHDTFLARASSFGALDLAVAHYRMRLRDDPEDAQAQRGMAQAVLLATHQTGVADRDAGASRVLYYLGLGVALALFIAVGVLLGRILKH